MSSRELLIHCPECGSTNVVVTDIDKVYANGLELFCHSIKSHDYDSPAECLDCGWSGIRQYLKYTNGSDLGDYTHWREGDFRMIATKEQMASFSIACKPLMMWMVENTHPHCTAVVTGGSAELLEGVMGVPRQDVFPDAVAKTKRTVPMGFRDKCKIVADGGELGKITSWGGSIYCETTDFAEATHYRTSPESKWLPCMKEVEQ